ncbi:hypothetical protein [Borrelia crocidurae]|uniref:ORFk-like protein, lipoprotein n=1 Tax=Borrelia crocidurae (strain Achema) TaxID=1155096 RepID=I0FEY5_BORCA|nr:hypothetical protein [Borrelia crocidurae]AFI32041.1 ORFk-like protein, lipoprotein [Borrelia crocidurae str. Achema]
MKKNKNILILCIILLYNCNANKTPSQRMPDSVQTTKSQDNLLKPQDPESKSQKHAHITLTTEEKMKFEIFIHALDISKKDKFAFSTKMKQDINQKVQNLLNKYDKFRSWILDDKHIQEQKELSKAFNYAYNRILYNKLKRSDNDQTTMQYIEGAFYYYLYDQYKDNHHYDGKLYGSTNPGFPNNYVSSFFEHFINTVIAKYDTNEKIFQAIKNELEDKNSALYAKTLNMLS